MVHAWASRRLDVSQPRICFDTHSWVGRVSKANPSLGHLADRSRFIAWYYYVAPNHSIFAIVRRTLTLMNLLAFITFTFYPTMPPRLLPEEYGFLDTVRHDNAQSVFMRGDAVNSLAAMPSMHFGRILPPPPSGESRSVQEL